MITGIHHVSLKCGDPETFEKAKNFYCGTLGLPVYRSWPAGVMIRAGDSLIEIFNNGQGVREKGAVRHFALAVDDTDAYAEKIRNAGYTVFEEPREIVIPSDPPLPARIAFCRGPLDEEIELFSEKKDPAD